MTGELRPDNLSSVSGALDANYLRRHDQSKNQDINEDGNEDNREGKKCPHCNREYPRQNNYCRMDGSRLELTNLKTVENF